MQTKKNSGISDFSSLRNTADTVSLFSYKKKSFSPLYPLMSAIVPWRLRIVKGDVTNLLHEHIANLYPFISETHSENTSPAFFPVFAEHTSSYLYFASYFPDVTS